MGNQEIKPKNLNAKKWSDIIFYACFAALPLLQYAIFYVAVNANSIALAFQKYEIDGLSYKYVFYGFGNFKQVLVDLFSEPTMLRTLRNSAVAYLSGLLITTPLALFFSYYIMKKFTGSGFFRVILFIPTIVCSIISLFIFKLLFDNIIPEIIEKLFYSNGGFEKEKWLFLTNIETRFDILVFYSVFVGFGTNVLLYTGAMSGVDTSMVEAAQLDGVSDFQEFIYIIFPVVYPTLVTFCTVGVGSFFTSQLFIYDIYADRGDPYIWTLGYYMYKSTVSGEGRFELYPYLSAMGLIFTLIAFPISLTVRRVMEKIGPSEE